MTDNEIRKALECCFIDCNCGDCPYYYKDEGCCPDMLMNDALDLINRQKAEIERLENENNDKERAHTDEFLLRKEWQRRCRELLEEKQNAKSEAIKEFAGRLKKLKQMPLITTQDIDNLVKEMTENNFKE